MTCKLIQLGSFTKLHCVCFWAFQYKFHYTQLHLFNNVHRLIITVDTEVVDVAWTWLGGVGSSPGHIPAHDIIKHGGTGQIYEKKHLRRNAVYLAIIWTICYLQNERESVSTLYCCLLSSCLIVFWCVRIDYRVYRLNCYTKHSIL